MLSGDSIQEMAILLDKERFVQIFLQCREKDGNNGFMSMAPSARGHFSFFGGLSRVKLLNKVGNILCGKFKEVWELQNSPRQNRESGGSGMGNASSVEDSGEGQVSIVFNISCLATQET